MISNLIFINMQKINDFSLAVNFQHSSQRNKEQLAL